MRTKDKMQLWLTDYERSRHSKQPNGSWISSRYDIQGMHWQELQQLYLPELNMRWGPAVSALKKLWKSYKIAGRTGEPRSDTAWKISRIQAAMGLERSEFPELEGINDDQDQELTAEEIHPEEWSDEDEQLRREEIEAERENDEWWISY